MNRFLGLVLTLLLFNLSGFAKGNIAGKVSDEKNGEPIIGATIVILGTPFGGVTDVDGQFILTVDPGNYSIEVKYLGYEGKEITDVIVKDDVATTLNVVVSPAKSTELGGFTVRSSFKKENISALYAIQKNSASIQDGISADVIKRSADRSTGDVLKRVSGASVQDNKFLVVRGLNERYNVALMNNSILPSTEPDKKAFSFDLIPSNLVDNITIYKSATPDLPGDFAGGAVRVNTKDFPESKILEVGISTTFNDATTGKNFFTGARSGVTDGLGYLDKSRDLPSSFPNKTAYLNLPQAEQIAITKDFPDNFGYKSGGKSLPELSAQLTSGNTYKIGSAAQNKLGYIFSVGYSNGRKLSTGSRDDFDVSKTKLYHYDNSFYKTAANLGTILNLSYTYGRSKISLKNFYKNEFQDNITLRNGANFERDASDPLFVKSYSEDVSQNALFNTGLEGSHTLNEKSRSKIDWSFSYSRASRNAPDQKILTLVQDLNDGKADHPYFIKLNNVNSPAIKDAGRIYSNLAENIYSAGANYSTEFKTGNSVQKIKGGFLGTYRSRIVDVNALGYASTAFSGQTIYAEGDVGFSNIFSTNQLDKANPPILLANILTNSIDYTGSSRLLAGYVMNETELTPKLRAVYGARAEQFQQDLKLGKSGISKEDFDILPSVNFTYALNEKSNLRLSGFQSVNRPEFREFAPYRYYDYDNDFIVGGNPNLKRSKITNADLRFETYPAAGEILSASVFYKNFKNPIEQINQGNNVLTYENVDNALLFGVEAEVRKNLSFIAPDPFLEQLSVYLNVAYIKGTVDIPNKGKDASLLQGQSPYIINTGLSYSGKKDGLDFNLLYNRIGERIKFRGQGFADIWEKGRNVVDFQVGKKLFKGNVDIKLTLSNVLNSAQVYYYKYGTGTSFKEGEDKAINTVNFGRSAQLSFKLNL